MRELLPKFGSPDQIATLSEDEIARALLGAMKTRAKDPVGGMANRDHAVGELFGVGGGHFRIVADRELQPLLERKFRRAWSKLDEQELIEPASGYNGKNGYVVLTPKGNATDSEVCADEIRIRALLKDEMLHPKLRGEPLRRYRDGVYGNAVSEAFKIVEVEVREAAQLDEDKWGTPLMQHAFNENGGPLTNAAEEPSARKALPQLFSGSLGRFKNPDSHTHRQVSGPMEAIEELLLASRLLRFVDERR